MDGPTPGPPGLDRAKDLLRRGWPLLVLALAARVAQIVATPDWVAVSDPADYVRHAVSIAHGHGFPGTVLPQGGSSALRPPLYPWFLGGVFAITGDSETAGRLASALLGVVSVALIGLVADMLWSRRVAHASMALAAVYPPLVLVSGTLLSESLALPLVLGIVALLVAPRPGAERGRRTAIAAGFMFGLALLDRPALSVLAVPLVAALWGRPRLSRRAAIAPAVALAVAALTILPWTIRNASEFHDLVPISTQSGFLIAGTYNRVADHDPVSPGAYRPAGVVPELRPVLLDPALDENQVGKKLGAIGRRYAQDHPAYVPRVLWWNGRRMLSLTHPLRDAKAAYAFQGIGPGWATAALAGFWIVAFAALAGVALGAFRGRPAWLWITPLLLYVSVIWISGDTRYRLPIEPFFVWAAAVAAVAALEKLLGSGTVKRT
jgi:4-amino-4-deoxy-L-arabinose transferase-like glycosyltransferase